jgi:hypothetical protein
MCFRIIFWLYWEKYYALYRPFISFILVWIFFHIVHTFADVADRFKMQSVIFWDLPENRSAAQTANTHAIRAV